MDKFRNHVDKYYDICPSTCKVDNCPVGYTRRVQLKKAIIRYTFNLG